MTFIFKTVFIIANFILSFAMIVTSTSSICIEHKGASATESAQLVKYKQSFGKLLRYGIIVKIVYWLLIPDTNHMVTIMLAVDTFVMMFIMLFALLHMLPLHIIIKSYSKTGSISSVYWLLKSVFSLLIIFVVAWFLSAPVIW